MLITLVIAFPIIYKNNTTQYQNKNSSETIPLYLAKI